MDTLQKLTNEGRVDRIARVVVGVILVSLVFVGPQTPWGLIGFIPLVTGALGFCPLYHLLGIRTCSSDEAPDAA